MKAHAAVLEAKSLLSTDLSYLFCCQHLVMLVGVANSKIANRH